MIKLKDTDKVMPYEESVHDGDVLVFLHGFPDNCGLWKNQMLFFQDKYHLLNFNLPGSFSGKVADKTCYKTSSIVSTMKNKILEVSRKDPQKKFVLIGHDIGTGLIHELAKSLPGIVKGEILVSGMSLSHFTSRILSSPRQFLRSTYMLLFFIPGVAELIRLMKNPRTEAPHGLESIFIYREVAKGFPYKELPQSEFKTLLVFGTRDPYLNLPTAGEVEKFYHAGTLTVLDSGHWIPEERPEELNKILESFITQVVA